MLDRKRHLRFDYNALASLEEDLGISPFSPELLKDGMTPRKLRAFLRAGLLWETPALTLEQAGALVTLENHLSVARQVVDSFVGAFGQENPPENGQTAAQ